MARITKDKAITVDGNTWWVNSRLSGLFMPCIITMIRQLDAMLSHHNKVHLLRFDLRLYRYTPQNTIITEFNKRFHKWLRRKYKLKRVGFLWCREQETQINQHYHYALMIDGNKVCFPDKLIQKIKEIWNEQLQGSAYIPQRCYYNLSRNDYTTIQNAIWRISYLAKVRSKGGKPTQTKSFNTSRIKKKTGAS